MGSKGKENAPVTVNSSESKEQTSVTDVEDKIKARAERFGGFQSEDAKKVARAPSPDLDVLKKRAERFGTASSTVVKQAELDEAIKRRRERFGVISKDEPKPKKVALNSGVNSVLLDEKLKARRLDLEFSNSISVIML